MNLLYISMIIPLVNAIPGDGPSYRSSIMMGDKPILRMPLDESDTETGVEEDKLILKMSTDEPAVLKSESEEKEKPPKESGAVADSALVEDVSLLIAWLVETFGYNVGNRHHSRRNKELAVLQGNDQVPKVKKEGPKSKKRKRVILRSMHELEKRLRSHQRTHPAKLDHASMRADDAWMIEFKTYVKDLISRYGQEDIVKYVKPVVATLEKAHFVKINDIDVDQYGEIIVNYKDKRANNKHEYKPLRYTMPKDDD